MLPYIKVALISLSALSPLVFFASHLSNVENITPFLGRFHPVVLHLPIGVILLVAFMETIRLFSLGRIELATRLPVFLGAASAVAAMVLGVLLMQGESMQGALVISHLRWGIATAVAANLMLLLRFWPSFDTVKSIRGVYYSTVYATCGILTWASHQGASITHGENYLTAYAPWVDHSVVSAGELGLVKALSLPVEERNAYEHLIAPIFEQKCYDCHKTSSFKGNLVMDSYQGLLKGGDTGPSLVPGDLNASLMIERMHLPIADDERMPPSNKEQLTDGEIQLIEWWIQSGASQEQTLASLKPSNALSGHIDEVTEELLLRFHTVEVEQEEHRPSQKEVAELRKVHAAQVADLQNRFFGMIDYVNAESAEVAVRAFHHQWSDADMAALNVIAPLVVELVVPRNVLTKESLQHLQYFTSLKKLDLRYAMLGDEFVAAMPVLPLEQLNLYQTGISGAVVEHLQRYPELERLTLGGNDISAEAISELQSMLPSCIVTGDLSMLAASK